MKNVLFVVVLILVFAYGYYLMCKFDNSILSSNKLTKIDLNKTDNNPHILVFGKTALANSLVEISLKNNCFCQQVEYESQVDRNKDYEYLFASSERDLDNLMFCVFAKRYMVVKNITAICNSPENWKIFEDSGDKYYITDQITAEVLFESTGLRSDS